MKCWSNIETRGFCEGTFTTFDEGGVLFVSSTYCDGPPVTELTDGVGQDEGGKPEDSQELREERT